MADFTTDHGISWRRLEPFGVEVDANLADPIGPARGAMLKRLLWENGLVLARTQSLSMERQSELTSLAGPIVRRPQENGYISTENDGASRSELSFHADAAYTEAPFAAISLHAIDVVDGASSTRFASAERAYETLPDWLRARLDNADAEMISPTIEGIAIRACDWRDPPATLRARLPAVRKNPRTGRRCIGVSEMHTARLADIDWEEGHSLLSRVFEHVYAPANCLEHVWSRGDLILWDNLTLQHARGSLQRVGRRVLQRVVAGSEATKDMTIFEQAARL